MTRSHVSAGARSPTALGRTESCAEIDAANSLGTAVHPHCVACSSTNAHGLGLRYVRVGTNAVEADVDCPPDWEGYRGVVHGGIVALMLDSAMTNCLFASGKVAMTAELLIRYHAAVLTGTRATVRAVIRESTSRRHVVEGRITQEGRAKVTATGKFLAGGM